METNNFIRTRKLIEKTIDLFDLDLSSLTVLTEAANGNFYVTPVIAALAGAKVYALSKDSAYGRKEDIEVYLARQAEIFDVTDKIKIIRELTSEIIFKCDIITNLGSLRPIDAQIIKSMKHSAVITSMCEDWEVRESDIDRAVSREKGILLGAVNEESSYTNIFRYVGYLALKLIMEAGLEIFNNRFLIISSDKFGRVITEVLELNGSSVQLSTPDEIDIDHINTDYYDALIVADYSFDRPIVSTDGVFNAKILKSQFPDSIIIHMAGEVDTQYLKDNGIFCYPDQQGYKQKMTRTLDYLGIRPLIELHTAGLKVGEILARERKSDLSVREIEQKLVNHPLCQLIS